MSPQFVSRRRFLSAAGLSLAAAAADNATAAQAVSPPFVYCLNTATLRGHKLPLIDEIQVAAKAGYNAVELWLDGITAFTTNGASLTDLKKRIADLGLSVENVIAFANWIVDDDAERTKGLEQAKRNMDTVSQIGCKRIAAPPAGAQRGPAIDLQKAAERYRTLLDLGDQTGVVPILELWGSSANINRIGQAAFVAAESGHPKAALLLDVFHIYKGGSDFNALKLLSTNATPVFHINDYPAQPPRDAAKDSDRVFPGDGIAPLDRILRHLQTGPAPVVLSLELFNPDLAKQDPILVAKTGLQKTKAVAEKATA